MHIYDRMQFEELQDNGNCFLLIFFFFTPTWTKCAKEEHDSTRINAKGITEKDKQRNELRTRNYVYVWVYVQFDIRIFATKARLRLNLKKFLQLLPYSLLIMLIIRTRQFVQCTRTKYILELYNPR